jgi:predicted CXXCH cytochrome family protein
MKKLLIAVVLGLVLVFALATTALADNGPHGNFQASTDACASCHRAHSAQGKDFLLISSDIYTLCTNCHDGTGAYTNVVQGIYMGTAIGTLSAPYGTQGDANVGLFGGGFEQAAMTTARGLLNGYDASVAAPTPINVTSHHDVVGGAGPLWGAGVINTTTDTSHATSYTLECTSCHDPHGKAGKATMPVAGSTKPPTVSNNGTPIATYRLLRYQPEGSNGYQITTGSSAAYWVKAGITDATAGAGSSGVLINDIPNYYLPTVTASYWYTINSDSAVDPSVQAYSHRAGTPWWSYVNNKGDYAGRSYIYTRPAFVVVAGTASGAGSQLSCAMSATGAALDTSCAYAGALKFNNTTPMANMSFWCATCHDRYIAGSDARSNTEGDAVYKFRHSTNGSAGCVNCHTAHGATSTMTPLAAADTLNTAAGLTGNTNMLKLDNRGLCADCHGYDVGFGLSTQSLVTP